MTEEVIVIKRYKSFILGICQCGCGKEMDIRTLRGLLRRYIPHHQPIDYSKISREKHPNWKNGERKNGKYMKILRRHHPYSDNHGYVFRHRYRMELMLGRYLTRKEVIHHISAKLDENGFLNDDEDNLMLFASHSEHISYEQTIDMTGRICRICGTDKTYINKKGRPKWHGNDIDGRVCHNCYCNIQRHNKNKINGI
jgi:hypothetical protein